MSAYHCWEYYVFDANPDDDDLERELCKIGKDGWEISGILDSDIIIFKRPFDGLKTYTGSGTRRKRPERHVKEEE